MKRGRKGSPKINCVDCNIKLDDNNTVIYIMTFRTRIMSRCRECHIKYQRGFYIKGNHSAKQVIRYREKKYGITQEEYNKLFEFQQGGCAICRKLSERSLDVDHNHKINKVRGLLCSACNTALGLLKEDEDVIWNMLEYLKKHQVKIAS